MVQAFLVYFVNLLAGPLPQLTGQAVYAWLLALGLGLGTDEVKMTWTAPHSIDRNFCLLCRKLLDTF